MAKITIEIPDHLIPSFFNEKPAYVLHNRKIKSVNVESLYLKIEQTKTDQETTEDNPYPDLEFKIEVGELSDFSVQQIGSDIRNYFSSKQALIDHLLQS